MNLFHDYRMYGISLRSEIPFSFPEQTIASPDITVRLESEDWFRKVTAGASVIGADTGWYERIECRDGSEFIRWPGLFEFLVSPDGRTVACRALEQSRPESFQTYLFGQVLSFALIKQGHEPLHATAVVIDGAAIGFLGASGQGKSTLASAFLSAGYRVLTDDLLVIRDIGGVLCGFPGPPRIKLFSEAAKQFLPGQASLARMNPDSNKYVIALPPDATHAAPAPIQAFLVLDGLEVPEGTDPGGVEMTPLSAASSCIELLGASFNKKLVGPARLRRQFVAAREWASRIPVKRLRYAWSFDAVDEVVRAIVADVSVAREWVM